MKIIIKGTNLELTESLKAYVEEKVGHLEHYSEEILEARVELEVSAHHQKGFFRCEVNLDVPQKYVLRAESTGPDLYAAIDAVLEEWNKRNPEPLREVLLKGQVRYAEQTRKKIMPPNCDNQGYYKDMLICQPDGLCGRIKNPVQYAKRRAFLANLQKEESENDVKTMRSHLTEEQKEMRKKFREGKKEKGEEGRAGER